MVAERRIIPGRNDTSITRFPEASAIAKLRDTMVQYRNAEAVDAVTPDLRRKRNQQLQEAHKAGLRYEEWADIREGEEN